VLHEHRLMPSPICLLKKNVDYSVFWMFGALTRAGIQVFQIREIYECWALSKQPNNKGILSYNHSKSDINATDTTSAIFSSEKTIILKHSHLEDFT
jgi:hypothetical protein